MSAILGNVASRALKATMMAVARWCLVTAVIDVICVGGPHRTVSASPASSRCKESTVKEAGAKLAGCNTRSYSITAVYDKALSLIILR